MIFDSKNGRPVITISEEEADEIHNAFKELELELSEYLYYEREELYCEVSQFITNEAIKGKLANLRYHITNDLDYNSAFKDVVFFKNGNVEFIKDDNLYAFASSYQIRRDISPAIKVLKNILKVQLIDWLIENDFKQDNAKNLVYNIPLKITTQKKTMYESSIFYIKESEELFHYIINNTSYIHNRKNIGGFYNWFSSKLKCSQYRFALFWNSLNLTYRIKIYNNNKASFDNTAVDSLNIILNDLESEFNKLHSSK